MSCREAGGREGGREGWWEGGREGRKAASSCRVQFYYKSIVIL